MLSPVDHGQWLMLRPMSPILSIASIRHTPRPGLPTGVWSTPKDMEEVLRSNNIKAVLCEDLPDEPPPKLQDVLYVHAYILPLATECKGLQTIETPNRWTNTEGYDNLVSVCRSPVESQSFDVGFTRRSQSLPPCRLSSP